MDYELYAHDPDLAALPMVACVDALATRIGFLERQVLVQRVRGAVDQYLAPPPPSRTESQAETKKPQYDYDLRVSRSLPRLKNGEIAFECKYGDDAPVKVGLTAFFDEEGWCTDGEVCAAVNNWCAKAGEFPLVHRRCLTCKAKAVKGFVLCGRCDKKWGSVIYAE